MDNENPETGNAPVEETAAPEAVTDTAEASPAWKRFLPLGVIAIALVLFFATGLNEYFTLETLKENRDWLLNFAAENRFVAPLVLVVIYAAAVAISFPGASILTIFSGFMFGTWIGGTAVLFGATIGATIIFLAARNATGDALLAKAGPTLKKLEAGFRESELSYMFLLRLVPAFPFWLVNLAPAALGVKLRNYMIATFFGIIPGTFVYAGIGNGLGATLDAGDEISLSVITEPEFYLPILGLIVLALIPIVYKKIKKED